VIGIVYLEWCKAESYAGTETEENVSAFAKLRCILILSIRLSQPSS